MDERTRADLLKTLTEATHPFLVPVPRPYIVDRSQWKDRVGAQREILREAGVLWGVLHILEIPLEEAHARGYTLNRDTRDELADLALRAGRGAGYRALDLLDQGPWKR